MNASTMSIASLAEELTSGDRRALAQAISLVESSHPSDEESAAELLTLIAERETSIPSRRIAVSGAPGVGKSTLLERFGLKLIDNGHRIAILAVDPSSRRTGGSILGDKVRMPKLSLREEAFIRPSPSRRSYGGTTSATRDVITLCEAAGYDTVIVETVGVGQSEIDAADMVDLFLLLVMPASGDDLQGIKRGIMEVADVVVITKSDLSPDQTNIALAQHRAALQLMQPSRPGWQTPVVSTSSVTDDGLDDLLRVVYDFFVNDRHADILRTRVAQRLAWFDELLKHRLFEVMFKDPPILHRLTEYRSLVFDQNMPPTVAVRSFLHHLHVNITERS